MPLHPPTSFVGLLAVTVLLSPTQTGHTSSYRARSAHCTGDPLRVMVCLHEHARSEGGLPPLHVSVRLTEAARAKSADVARCGFSHTACGRPFEYEINKTGYRWSHVGENLAWGTGSRGRPYAIFFTWLRSPGHRANMLDPGFRDIGVAVLRGDFERSPNSAIWVAEFARH